MAERAKTLARIDQINGIGLAKARQAARTAFPSVAVLSLYLDLHGYFAVHPPIITAILDSATNFFHPDLRRQNQTFFKIVEEFSCAIKNTD